MVLFQTGNGFILEGEAEYRLPGWRGDTQLVIGRVSFMEALREAFGLVRAMRFGRIRITVERLEG